MDRFVFLEYVSAAFEESLASRRSIISSKISIVQWKTRRAKVKLLVDEDKDADAETMFWEVINGYSVVS